MKVQSSILAIPLDSVPSTDVNYAQAFSDLTIGKYTDQTKTNLDKYLEEYLEYFGTKIEDFNTVEKLRALNHDQVCKNYWIDIDHTTENVMDAITHLDRSKIIAIANVTSRQQIEDLNIDPENVIFKPVTLSKLKNLLTKIADNAPQLVEELDTSIAANYDAKVLVTEDNVINQKLITRILEEHSIRVDIANNGLEAFEKRRNNSYDLIFMDVQMPVMDGIEATHEILDYEEDEEVPHIPIIALTANALKGDREKYISEGMDEYITKPIETSELHYILNKFLSDKAIEITVETSDTNKEEQHAPLSEVPVETSNEVQIHIDEEDEDDDYIPVDYQEEKRILIAKKFLIEKRVLEKVLDNLGLAYTTLNNNDEITESLRSNKFDILLTDEFLLTDTIKNTFSSVSMITEAQSKEEIQMLVNKLRG